MQTLIQTIQLGWPKKIDTLNNVIHYYSFQDELSIQDGIIFRGERAVIPDTFGGEITKLIHSTHIGFEGYLRRARECVYWQGMNEQVKAFLEKCDICRTRDTKQQKETT
jgi:hypothetical protein